MTDIFTKQV